MKFKCFRACWVCLLLLLGVVVVVMLKKGWRSNSAKVLFLLAARPVLSLTAGLTESSIQLIRSD